MLHYYRCLDCLTTMTADAKHREPRCGACGGRLCHLGEVRGDRWTRRGLLPKCDGRCVNAAGPNCDCQCGGTNHGGGLLACAERTVESGRVSLHPRDAEAARLRAEEYREVRGQAKARLERLPGYDDYKSGVWVPGDAYCRLRQEHRRFHEANGLCRHSARLAALAEVAKEA